MGAAIEDIYKEFRKAAHQNRDRVLIYQAVGSDSLTYTYGRVLEEVDGLAAYLAKQGAPKGTNVAILSENRYEWVVAYLASVSLGFVVVPLDPLLSLADWENILRHSEAEILFVSDRFKDQGEVLHSRTISLKEVIFFREGLPQGERASLQRPDVSSSDVASIVYTSGTTGTPKGVMLTHGNLISNGRVIGRRYEGLVKIKASILPLNHIYGFDAFLTTILNRQSIILYPKLEFAVLFKSFRDLKPHCIAGVPAFFERIAASIQEEISSTLPRWLRYLIEKLREGWMGEKGFSLRFLKKRFFQKVHEKLGGRIEYCPSGGAALEPKVIRLFNLLGIPILEGYGLTETSPLIAANDSCSSQFRIGSVGKPVAGTEVRIDQPDPSGVGEICVKGPNVMKGYYKNSKATQEVIDSEGWFHTEDLGYLDKDGFLFISGRKKEVIVTANGKNIYPAELEHYFSQIKLIKELCVFGVNRRHPSRSREEIVHLQIVPDLEGAKREGIEDVYSTIRTEVIRLSEQLPEYKIPRSIGFSEEVFPRSASLKIKKFLVKQEWIEKQRFPEKMTTRAPEPDTLIETIVGSAVAKIVKSILQEEMPVTSASSFDLDLGFDSLTRLEFWAAVGKVFGISVPEDKTTDLKTVGQVIEYLQNDSAVSQKVHAASIGLEIENITKDNWDGVLEANAEESRRIVETVLNSYPRLRPLFLKLFRLVFRHFSRLKVRGLENLPAHGPYILAPNHESHLDNLFVACFLPPSIQQEMLMIGKKEHWDHRMTRTIAKLCHAVPVDRSRVSNSVMQICAQVLRQGKILLVHPEGTRSPDGRLLPFKNGVAILANHLHCAVVPVCIEGAHEFWPKDSILPKSRSDISVVIGKPLYPVASSVRIEEFTAKLMMNIVALSQALKGRKTQGERER